jgi:heme-degrading monooxygenase HmoA
MFMVVSHWKPLAGQETRFEEIGRQARSEIRGTDGIELVEAFRSGDEYIVIHGYRDYDTYARLVESEDGPVAQSMMKLRVDEFGEWLGSERGETIE